MTIDKLSVIHTNISLTAIVAGEAGLAIRPLESWTFHREEESNGRMANPGSPATIAANLMYKSNLYLKM